MSLLDLSDTPASMSWLFGLALFAFSRSYNVVLFVAGVACVSCLFSICDFPFGQ